MPQIAQRVDEAEDEGVASAEEEEEATAAIDRELDRCISQR